MEEKVRIKTLNGYGLEDTEVREAVEQVAGEVIRLSEEIGKRDKPRVYIDGVIPTTKDDVLAELTYEHGPERWHAYIKIKCQGSSSMRYPKKNFTVKLYEDQGRSIPFNITFDIFGQPSNKFVLKANWVDHTHARNIVAARIWGEIVASRPDYDALPEQMRNSPNNGAINGFPITVYTNGSYQGAYTWNIGKDALMWGMNEDDPNQALLCGEYNSLDAAESETATNFRKLWDGTENHWKIELGKNTAGIVEGFNRLISCVKDTTEVECKATLSNYLDVQSAIDYDLANCFFCGVDNSARNMLAQSYNLALWRLGMYDLDNTFGGGSGAISPDSVHLGSAYYEQNSLLWERIEKLFPDWLKQRGRELRKGILSYSHVMSHFEEFIGSIGKEVYEDDFIPYPDIPAGSAEPIWQFRNWVRDRLAYFDSWLDGLGVHVLCKGITLDKTSLTFTSATPQALTATLTPVDCTDVVKWSSSDPSIATVDDGIVTPVRNGSVTITANCGGFIATCAVTISSLAVEDAPMYNLSAPVTLASTDDVIDTGVKLLDEDRSFTVLMDFTADSIVPNTNRYPFYCPAASSNIQSRAIGVCGNGWDGTLMLYNYVADSYDSKKINDGYKAGKRNVVVLRRKYGSADIAVTANNDTGVTTETFETKINEMIVGDAATTARFGGYMSFSGGAWSATNYWPGTIHRAKIYDYYMSDEDVAAFVADVN